jgi:hypothetical protein
MDKHQCYQHISCKYKIWNSQIQRYWGSYLTLSMLSLHFCEIIISLWIRGTNGVELAEL